MEINKPVSIIIILIITLVIFFLFVLPKYQESKDLEIELAKKQFQYEKRVDYYLKLSDILNQIEQKKDILGKIDTALPSNIELAPLFYFFEQKTKDSGLLIKSLTFSQPEELVQISAKDRDKEIKDIVFRADLYGSYQSLKKFLYYLENSARLFEVNSISLTSDQSSDSGPLKIISKSYDFTLEITTHAY
ncbi:MAG: type 4a pilus biogenesis protein PilO [Patescibacteria group bacterium]|mgnify:FL=1